MKDVRIKKEGGQNIKLETNLLDEIAQNMLKLLPDYESKSEIKYISKQENHCKTTKPQSGSFPCKKCDYVSTQSGHLKRHWIAKHTEQRYECGLCGSVFTMVHTLNRHKSNKHGGLRFRCQEDDCSFEATRRSSVKEHMERNHTDKLFPCHHCDLKAESARILKKHLALSHEGRVFYCPECDYSHWERMEMRRHVEVKHKGVRYQCRMCAKRYTKGSSVTVHMRQVHGEER